MNKYKKFICFIVIIETILVLICNGLYIYLNDSHIEKLYRVEANRVVKDIEEKIQTKNPPERPFYKASGRFPINRGGRS